VTGSSVRGRHLPALDGLRALAVLAVLAYHLGYPWARGGYLGVDLFFVLSGFLITSLLLEEHEETGTIRLAKFWARRARRLLPALFVMVAAVMAFVLLEGRYGQTDFVAAIDLSALRSQALATLLYVANWQQIFAHHSYFAQFSAPSPLDHTWSLAIEEQFYLVWPPLVTLGLLAKGLGQRRRLGISFTIAIAVASTAFMAFLFNPGGDPTRVYFGTDTRLGDLAVGALLAWLTARRPETPPRIAAALRVAAPVALAGLLVLMVTAGSASELPSNFMFEGGFLGASILCAIVLADVRREGSVLAACFSWRPLVAIGLVSYGIYLWHYPVIVLFTTTTSGLSGAPLLVGRLATIAALVLASYFVVELPVRRQRIRLPSLRWVTYTVGVAATVVAVIIGTSPSLVVHAYVRATLLRYAPAAVIPGAGDLSGQLPIAIDHPISRSDPLRVVLVGDSQFEVSGPGIIAALEATGEAVATNKGYGGWGTSTVPNWRIGVREAVTETHADVVLATTGWDGQVAEDPSAYERTLRQLVGIARSAGAKGVVFIQYPITHPIDAITPATLATAVRHTVAWNAVVDKMPSLEPGRVMYFPVASSVELNGQFSAWLPPPRDPSAPESTWDRIRRLDGTHLCPAGTELFAAAIAEDVSTIWHLPAPRAGWWVDGWQRDSVVASGDQFCPADHPPG
jgi:peptidoglycan/LPS O-acetylase OafA/YrhL/lysophospholipase L1-like esterase